MIFSLCAQKNDFIVHLCPLCHCIRFRENFKRSKTFNSNKKNGKTREQKYALQRVPMKKVEKTREQKYALQRVPMKKVEKTREQKYALDIVMFAYAGKRAGEGSSGRWKSSRTGRLSGVIELVVQVQRVVTRRHQWSLRCCLQYHQKSSLSFNSTKANREQVYVVERDNRNKLAPTVADSNFITRCLFNDAN